jgi:hypothetical protein
MSWCSPAHDTEECIIYQEVGIQVCYFEVGSELDRLIRRLPECLQADEMFMQTSISRR